MSDDDCLLFINGLSFAAVSDLALNREGDLCDAVRFEVDELVGPFELCRYTRCRKSTGSAFVVMVGAKASAFRIANANKIKTIELPISESPPAYVKSIQGFL